MGRSLSRSSLYGKIIFGTIWLGAHISIYFISKTREGKVVDKRTCRLSFESEPLLITKAIVGVDVHLLEG